MPLMFPKSRPLALDRADKKRAQQTKDQAESEKARQRANGRCEIVIIGEGRCRRKDMQTHHMLAGHGRRLTPEGMKAERKQRACLEHHDQVQQRILVRVGDVMPHYADVYERIR